MYTADKSDYSNEQDNDFNVTFTQSSNKNTMAVDDKGDEILDYLQMKLNKTKEESKRILPEYIFLGYKRNYMFK